jgi:Periviscerokinin family
MSIQNNHCSAFQETSIGEMMSSSNTMLPFSGLISFPRVCTKAVLGFFSAKMMRCSTSMCISSTESISSFSCSRLIINISATKYQSNCTILKPCSQHRNKMLNSPRSFFKSIYESSYILPPKRSQFLERSNRHHPGFRVHSLARNEVTATSDL